MKLKRLSYLISGFVLVFTIFSPWLAIKAKAGIDTTNLTVIDKSKIRVDSIVFSSRDWRDAPESIKNAFPDPTGNSVEEVLNALYGGKTFEDTEVWDDDDNYRLEVERAGRTCEGDIEVTVPSGDIAFDVFFEIPVQDRSINCESSQVTEFEGEDINVSGAGNLIKAFRWLDETTIKRYGVEETFTKAEGQAGRYYLDSEEGQGACRDYLTTIDFENASYFPLTPSGGTEDCTIENPWELDPHPEVSSGFAVRIGDQEERENPPGTGGDGSGDSDGEGGDDDPTCESENLNVLDWVICGAIGVIDKLLIGEDGTSGLFGEVNDLLNISDQYYEDEGLITAWSYFKNLASLALVLIGLIMVIGQAMSKE